jgi:uncharacterized protein (TIGR03083 family)
VGDRHLNFHDDRDTLQRAALADDLEALTDEQWTTPSLCREWTVRGVVAHMTGGARIGPSQLLAKFVKAGFSYRRVQHDYLIAELGASPAETLSHFRAIITMSRHPNGPDAAWLGEAIIHAEDIRRALRIAHVYPTKAVIQVADFYAGTNLIVGAKDRVAGLRLVASDTDWSHGNGPTVSGPALALLMAMTGRSQALSDLTGDAVDQLRARNH